MAVALGILAAGIGLALLVLLIGQFWGHTGESDLTRARKAYDRQRESLHKELFRRAAATGRPRGLRWKGCDFDSHAILTRDAESRQLLAFVGVTISFEA